MLGPVGLLLRGHCDLQCLQQEMELPNLEFRDDVYQSAGEVDRLHTVNPCITTQPVAARSEGV